MNSKVLLVILDGFGCRKETLGNAIKNAKAPFFRKITAEYPWELIHTSGKYVGLPDGQMGNSEVGHINIGAGRIVYQESSRIKKSIEEGEFFKNDTLLSAIDLAKKNESKIHLMGLVSDGGVHSDQEHIYALLDLFKNEHFDDVFIHAFLDGRDTAPNAAVNYIESLEHLITEKSIGKIASVSGRYFAMDRDKRWERLNLAFNAFNGEGDSYPSALEGIKESYSNEIFDEFVKPFFISSELGAIGKINENDIVICFNFRSDRVRQLSRAFADPSFSGFNVKVKVKNFIQFTEYDSNFSLKTVFPKHKVEGTLGEIISLKGMKQLRAAETEKYAHVTFFFNGGIDAIFKGEERLLINSPKVATYDQKPEMSAFELTDKLCEKLKSKEFNFITVNYANSDMVGHTGDYDAAVKAIESLDKCLEQLISDAKEYGYEVIITADHGNAEQMYDESGSPFTQHTTGPVPFIYIGEKFKKIKEGGRLCDVAPSILELFNFEKTNQMTGISLFEK
jgi:2,3-bisphosphoglycerate-independent phosphoglycerate mutase